jgi:hypothetical protein
MCVDVRWRRSCATLPGVTRIRRGALGCSAWVLLGCQGAPVGGELAADAGSDGWVMPPGWELAYDDSNAGEGDALHALWAASEDAVFAVGSNRQIVNYDGIEWTSLVKTAGAHLFGIWGASASDAVSVGLYSAGAKPAIFYYDGSIWTVGGPFPADMTAVTGVWGSGSQRYFTGLSGHIYQDDPIKFPNLRYHTAVITGGCPEATDPAPQLNGIDGSGIENILVVGDSGLMAHRDGSGWARFCSPNLDVHYASVTLVPGSKEFYVGSNYLGLLKWTDRSSPLLQIHEDRAIEGAEDAYLQAVWAASSALVVAVGDRGTILYYDGGPDGARALPSPTNETLYGVVGVGERTLYVCGKGNRIYKGEVPDG